MMALISEMNDIFNRMKVVMFYLDHKKRRKEKEKASNNKFWIL